MEQYEQLFKKLKRDVDSFSPHGSSRFTDIIEHTYDQQPKPIVILVGIIIVLFIVWKYRS